MYTYLLIILLKKDASSYKKTKKYVCLLTTYTEIHISHLSLKSLKVFSPSIRSFQRLQQLLQNRCNLF